MVERFPVQAGCEPWSATGDGENARIGICVLHGFTGNPHTSRPLGQGLSRRGFTVEVPRLPGHGTHWRDMAETTYDDWRNKVREVLDDLEQRCDAVFCAGLSMGGTLAIDMAWERTATLDGAIPINATVLPREGFLAAVAPLLEKIIKRVPAKAAGLVENDAKKPGVDEHAYDMVPTVPANSFLAAAKTLHARLEDIRVPLLVAYAPEDHSVPCENSREVIRRVPNAEELILNNSYHLATVDNDADLLEEKIAEFALRHAKPSG